MLGMNEQNHTLWKELCGDTKVHVFQNEHGERYEIIFPNGFPPLFAGDETDWKATSLFGDFIFSDPEMGTIANIVQEHLTSKAGV